LDTAVSATEASGRHSLSVIVTAMNEIGNLAPTVENIVSAAAPRIPDFEVIIIDDGSTDGTSALADRLAAADARIRVHHNEQNRGLAYSYRKGIELATKPYTSWVAGNNIIPRKGMEDLYDLVGRVDTVFSYVLKDVRGPARRAISLTLTVVVNLLFGVRMRYYTGPCVYRTDVLKRLRCISEGSMIVPEILLRMVKTGLPYVEIPLQPQPRASGTTKTFRLKNVIAVSLSLSRLFWDIQIRGARHGHRPNPVNLG
jgi:glycosyltransferase involved in cell wall biosynthesis